MLPGWSAAQAGAETAAAEPGARSALRCHQSKGGHLVEGITSLDDLKNVELHLFAYNSDTYESLGEYVTTID